MKAILSLLCWVLIPAGFADVRAEQVSDSLEVRSEEPSEEEPKLIGGRYIFMQSGFPVEKKTLQYQNLNGVLNDVQYGITDDISLAGGIVLPFYMYISGQYTKEVAPLQRLVIGNISGTSLFLQEEFRLRANMLYAGYTYGSSDNHATFSLGYLGTNVLPSGDLFFQFGGCHKLSKGIYVLGEMWYSSGFQEKKGISRWVRDSQGNPLLVDPSDPLGSAYQTKTVSQLLNRNTLYVNVQLRLISTKNNNKSWSFGLMYFANWGGLYRSEGAYGEVKELSNQFVLPMPSISFIQRIGDYRPPKIPIRPGYIELGI
jgi:hypothetical protein